MFAKLPRSTSAAPLAPQTPPVPPQLHPHPWHTAADKLGTTPCSTFGWQPPELLDELEPKDSPELEELDGEPLDGEPLDDWLELAATEELDDIELAADDEGSPELPSELVNPDESELDGSLLAELEDMEERDEDELLGSEEFDEKLLLLSTGMGAFSECKAHAPLPCAGREEKRSMSATRIGSGLSLRHTPPATPKNIPHPRTGAKRFPPTPTAIKSYDTGRNHIS